MTTRNPLNRIKNHTGTVHFATHGKRPACGLVSTHSGWMNHTIEDVTCARCIAAFGADTPTDLRDPLPSTDSRIARRAAERADRQAARKAS